MEDNKNITLKEKCKSQQASCDYRLSSTDYVIAHVDGRGFSKMIKNRFQKPFDHDFIDMMNKTAVYLCENIEGAKLAYVQSDEISVFISKDRPESEIFFGGRLCKMQSIIASLATAKFNQLYSQYQIRHSDLPIDEAFEKLYLVEFDCKVWNVPNGNDAFAWFLFRNIDCIRNSKQQTAQTWCSHKELMGLNTDEQVEYLKTNHGVDWYNLSDYEKFGRIITREEEEHTVTLSDGEEVTFMRNKFTIHNGVNLTDIESRNKFLDENPYFER